MRSAAAIPLFTTFMVAMGCSSTGKVGAGTGGALMSNGGTVSSTGGSATTTAIAATGGSIASVLCQPGITQVCVGPGLCVGAQACNINGTAWGTCDCGTETGGAMGTSSAGSSQALGGAVAAGGTATVIGTGGVANVTGGYAATNGGTANVAGGYVTTNGGTNQAASGGNLASGGSTSPADSGNPNDVLQPDGSMFISGIVRDFHTAFPDMEPCSHDSNKLCDIGGANIEEDSTPSDPTRDCTQPTKINGVTYPSTCIVATSLNAATMKPTYAGPNGGTITTTGKDNFDWWFKTDTSGAVNMAGTLTLVLAPNIDRMLVMDRGGIHNAREATLRLDDLALTAEQDYQFDMFYCERHTTLSDLAITTSIKFSKAIVVN